MTRRISVSHQADDSLPQVDITAPNHGVTVESASNGKTLWVNVDGVCVLRICRIPYLTMEANHTNAPPDEEFLLVKGGQAHHD